MFLFVFLSLFFILIRLRRISFFVFGPSFGESCDCGFSVSIWLIYWTVLCTSSVWFPAWFCRSSLNAVTGAGADTERRGRWCHWDKVSLWSPTVQSRSSISSSSWTRQLSGQQALMMAVTGKMYGPDNQFPAAWKLCPLFANLCRLDVAIENVYQYGQMTNLCFVIARQVSYGWTNPVQLIIWKKVDIFRYIHSVLITQCRG